MALSTSFYTVNSEVIGKLEGGSRSDFLSDALGSVAAVSDESGIITSTVRYSPYGNVISSTGPNIGEFKWLGAHGYRDLTQSGRTYYVRARHYSSISGWSSKDPLWPGVMGGAYCKGNPTNFTDPSGLIPCSQRRCCDAQWLDDHLYGLRWHCRSSQRPRGGWTPCQGGTYQTQCRDSIARRDYDCDDVKDAIRFSLDQCIRFGQGGRYNAVDPLRGTIGCCEDISGRFHYCGEFCCEANIADAHPCEKFCLVRHEQYHGRECKALPQGAVLSWREECAYLVGAKCMFHLFESACGLRWSQFTNFEPCKRRATGCLP